MGVQDERLLKAECQFDMWTTWDHSLMLGIGTDFDRKLMIKVLMADYWAKVQDGLAETPKGRLKLIKVYKMINHIIVYRLLTIPRLGMGLFIPHLSDSERRDWRVPNKLLGLPGSNT